ncbi:MULTISPECIES: hypothetical protein [Flavobacteriaceae]|uniref:hypothetical protein n=1 Tax=Flavobacteriaceae TaxID=49546 RepID=UPI000C30A391|nr:MULTISPECIES: hypothetical protein [Flavobacteriaceae]AUC76876.1 hypothetical protein CW732_14815 [Olleya sp. Bg11-27]MCH3882977.1 hypothetical protein [Tenacibaculum aquimarinum]MDO6600761.1 hypothetical protein [Tenacibaculum sp. 1_MG-2023]
MDIEDLMNNPKFNIDLGTLLMSIHSTNLMNSYHLKAILKRQIQILELQKGKTGQELEESVQIEIDSLNEKFTEWLKEDIINDVDNFSRD